MPIASWHGENMRCFPAFHCDLSPGINCYIGNNATGKTSLLEGLYFTLTGRSFRSRDVREMIQEGKDYSAFHAVMEHSAHTLDIVKYRVRPTQALLDGVSIGRWSQIASVMPVLFVDTHTHRQFSEAVDVRRKWFDWIMFHVEHSYRGHQVAYKKSMEQRIVALRQGEDPGPWEHMMLEHGMYLEASRIHMLNALQDMWKHRVTPIGEITFSYAPGYANERLETLWRKERYDDMRRGYARSGPHRFDIMCYQGTHLYHQRLSLGQQKIFITDLMLLAAEKVAHDTGVKTLWLMDDVASELDKLNAHYILEKLHSMQLQSIITALSGETWDSIVAVRPIQSLQRA